MHDTPSSYPRRTWIAVAIVSSVLSAVTTLAIVARVPALRRGGSQPPAGVQSSTGLPGVQDAMGPEELARLYAAAAPSVVRILVTRPGGAASGSGFFLDAEGEVLTNNHVVEGATAARVALNDGSERPARVVGRDPTTDVALLMVDAPRVPPPLVLGSSGTVEVGQMAVVIGSPFGLTQSLSAGYISARGRMLKSGDEYGTEIDDVLQTDAAVNPGNSGGPLLNAQGEVIGVTTAIFSTSRGFEGIGFAVPIDTVKAVLPSLRLHGRVVRPFLGIAGLDITPQLARRFDLPVAEGVLVQKVHAASAAEDAGVRAGSKRLRGPGGPIVLGGDVVMAVAGEPVRSMAEISRIVGQLAIGDAVTVTLARGSDVIDAVGTLGEHPAPD